MPASGNIKPKPDVPTGDQSIITTNILSLSDEITGERERLFHNITDFLNSLRFVKTERPNFSRTADEIIRSGYHNGCNEAGLVYAAILRAKGFSTTFIQAFLREDLSNYGKGGKYKRHGHVFLRVQTPDGQIIINPETAEITQDIPNEYLAGREGLDAWDIGLKTPEDYVDLFLKTKSNAGL